MGKTTFTSDYLLQQLRRHPDTVPCFHVAYSGGLDSHALLHALCAVRDQLDVRIAALHVHHGLQAEADHWERHCRQVCAALDVDFTVLSVDARAGRGESPEAAARSARYGAITAWLPARHCLLTAQHQDDQAETLLLQLLRGSGVSGMAAMPETGPCGAGIQLRPLLGVTRAALQDYARQHGLVWIEDPSNSDTAFDRNFLRQRVMPVLRERWPAASSSLSRSAAHCAAASELLAQQAAHELQTLYGKRQGTVSASGLAALSGVRRDNVLRAWLKQHTRHSPSTAVLARIVRDVLGSRKDGPVTLILCPAAGDVEVAAATHKRPVPVDELGRAEIAVCVYPASVFDMGGVAGGYRVIWLSSTISPTKFQPEPPPTRFITRSPTRWRRVCSGMYASRL